MARSQGVGDHCYFFLKNKHNVTNMNTFVQDIYMFHHYLKHSMSVYYHLSMLLMPLSVL